MSRCTTAHTWALVDTQPYQELHPRTGWPTGYITLTERIRCACGAWGMRAVRGIRERSAAAAMGKYRARAGGAA